MNPDMPPIPFDYLTLYVQLQHRYEIGLALYTNFFFQVTTSSLHMWMGVFQKLFDMFVREVHKLDQSAFMGKVRVTEEDDLGETLFDEHIKAEQTRVEKLKKDLEIKEEELEDIKSEVPPAYIRNPNQKKQPPKRHRAAVMLYRQINGQIEELVSIIT